MIGLITISLMLVSFSSWGATITRKNVNVLQILVDSGSFGNCMVKLDTSIGSGCSNWASMSCDGTFNPKDIGYRKLDMAQMAMALGKAIEVRVDNTKKHNGYCYVKRIDIIN